MAKNKRMLMVADGVGGWTNRGVDPGLYSKALCKKAGELFDQDSGKELKQILTEADQANPHKQGSSTAVMAKLHPGSTFMQTCNLGDSGYMIIRPKLDGRLEKVFRSQEQQHFFNCPYQCGAMQPSTIDTLIRKGLDIDQTKLTSYAQVEAHEIQHNDIIVLGSEGVFDNLFDEQIMRECIQSKVV